MESYGGGEGKGQIYSTYNQSFCLLFGCQEAVKEAVSGASVFLNKVVGIGAGDSNSEINMTW